MFPLESTRIDMLWTLHGRQRTFKECFILSVQQEDEDAKAKAKKSDKIMFC